MLLSPATWVLLLIAGAALYADKDISRAGRLGLVCYVLGYILSAFYQTVPNDDIAVLLWQAGLALSLLMYFFSGSGPWMMVGGAIAAVFYVDGFVSRYVFELALGILIFIAVVRIYCRVGYADPFAKMTWGMLMVAVLLGTSQIAICRHFIPIDMVQIAQNWGHSAEKSSCSMAFGYVTHFIPIIATLPFLLWISFRWKRIH